MFINDIQFKQQFNSIFGFVDSAQFKWPPMHTTRGTCRRRGPGND